MWCPTNLFIIILFLKACYLHLLKAWSTVYLMAEGATVVQWHTSCGKCLWGYNVFRLAAVTPLVPVRRTKDRLVHQNGGRNLLCSSLSMQQALASSMPWKRLSFKSSLYRPRNPIQSKALINTKSVIKHWKTRKKGKWLMQTQLICRALKYKFCSV